MSAIGSCVWCGCEYGAQHHSDCLSHPNNDVVWLRHQLHHWHSLAEQNAAEVARERARGRKLERRAA